MKSKLYLAIFVTLFIPMNFVSYAFEQKEEDKTLLDQQMEKIEFQKSKARLKPPTFTDEEYKQRLSEISGEINLSYNKYVRGYINAYTNTHREKSEIIIGKSTVYFPIFEDILAQYNLPTELKYMAIIESALKPTALSKAGAKGLWQFMPSTGELYQLDQNSIVDERCDTYLATDAAARYLRDMNKHFKDWMLTIAAYNCGPGRVNKAIKRAGSRNIWKIYPYLPKETRGYVPAFISVAYMMNYYYLHQMYPVYPQYDLQHLEAVQVFEHTTFNDIVARSGLSKDKVRHLNPGFKLDYIPANQAGYHLILPQNYMAYYTGKKSQIEVERVPEVIAKKEIKPTREIPFGEKVYISNELKPKDSGLVVYEFQKGDNLWEVAAKYPGVTIKDIIKINEITDYRTLRPGLQLLVPTKPKLANKLENGK